MVTVDNISQPFGKTRFSVDPQRHWGTHHLGFPIRHGATPHDKPVVIGP